MARWLSFALLVLSIASASKAESLRVTAALEWRQTPLNTGVGGMLLLEIPLNRLAAPPRVRLSAPPETEQEASAGSSEPPASTSLPTFVRMPTPERQTLSMSLRRIDPVFARRLVGAALRVAGQPQAALRLESIARRARASAILPELSLRAARSTAQALRLSPSGIDSFDYTQTGGADLMMEARATWKLDRLVFSDEELRVESLRAARDQARAEIVALVLKQLFRWHRARSRLTDPGVGGEASDGATETLEPEAALELELDMVEAEAVLDVLTDGLFSAALAGKRARVVPHPGHPSQAR